MGDKKNKIYWIVPVLVLMVVLVYYFYGWDIGASLNKDATVYNIAELTEKIDAQIDSGQKSGLFYIGGDISEDDLLNINNYICSINGSVEKYSVLEHARGGIRVMFYYEISDNYYVYEKYVNNQEIPDDRADAVRLYDEVVSVLDECISDDMSDYEKELSIHDYIVTVCEYGYTDYSKDNAYNPYGVLIQKKAVCNGYAETMALLMGCVGIESRIVTGYADGELHAWNMVLLDGEWYQVDATWDDPIPDRGDFAGHMYFNVTDDIMDDSHTWEKEDYEVCDSMKYNYYEQNNLICDYEGFKAAVTDAASVDINATVEVVLTDYSEDKYNFDFMQDIDGLTCYARSKEADSYGEYSFLTLYLNQGE